MLEASSTSGILCISTYEVSRKEEDVMNKQAHVQESGEIHDIREATKPVDTVQEVQSSRVGRVVPAAQNPDETRAFRNTLRFVVLAIQ